MSGLSGVGGAPGGPRGIGSDEVEEGGDLAAAIGALPGGVSPAGRERLERLVRDVLAAREG